MPLSVLLLEPLQLPDLDFARAARAGLGELVVGEGDEIGSALDGLAGVGHAADRHRDLHAVIALGGDRGAGALGHVAQSHGDGRPLLGRQEDGELVGAVAGDEAVGARDILERVSDVDQRPVAGLGTGGDIDPFEGIDVE